MTATTNITATATTTVTSTATTDATTTTTVTTTTDATTDATTTGTAMGRGDDTIIANSELAKSPSIDSMLEGIEVMCHLTSMLVRYTYMHVTSRYCTHNMIFYLIED